jgi:alpha-glucosidase (family GH31 glycosyl hydrolase)
MSLLRAYEDPIRVEVFPDATGAATGLLYLDDGLSNDYVNGAYTLVEFSFDGTLLTVTKAV